MSKYDKYKDTNIEWIGEIPRHWETKKIKYISQNHDAKRIPLNSNERFFLGGEYPYYGATGIFDRIKKFIFDGTYLLVGEDGAPFRDYQKEVAFLVEGKFWANNHVHILEIQNGNPNYLIYAINKTDWQLFITGSTREKLTQEKLANIPIIYPPLSEQTQISSYLNNKTSLIDKLINNNKKLIKLLEEKRTALINKVITKGLDSNVKMKDSGIEWIGEIPKHWEISNIKRVADIYGRIGFRGYTTQDIVPEGDGAITLSPSNIKSTRMLLDSCTYLSWEKYKESPEIMIFKKDIIFVKTGSTIGKVAMVETYPQEMTINPQLIVLKNLKVDAKYLYYNMVSTSFQYQVKREVRGGSTPAINQEKINNLTIVEAPLSEQTQISSYLDNKTSLIDKAIKEFKAENELLKEYRQSLISNVVTGKINVQDYQNN